MKEMIHLLALGFDQFDDSGNTVHTNVLAPSGVPLGGLTTKGSSGNTTFQIILQHAATIIIALGIVLALLFLIWGGVQWMMSQGDKHKVEVARSRIIYAIIGLVIIFLSFIIVNTLGKLFGVGTLVGY